MLGRRYVVKPGDTLSDIAEAHLGAAHEWPRIYYYNNRIHVMRFTGSDLPHPDRIAPGQLLLLPVLPRSHPDVPRPKPPRPARIAPIRPVDPGRSPFVFQYRLSELKLPVIYDPRGIYSIEMSGEVTLQTQQSYPTLSLADHRRLELQISHSANQAFAALAGETKLSLDGNALSYSSMLVSQSDTRKGPAVAVGIAVASDKPVPSLRFEYRFPALEGSSGIFRFWATNVRVTIDYTPTGRADGDIGRRYPVTAFAPDWKTVTILLAASAVILSDFAKRTAALLPIFAITPPPELLQERPQMTALPRAPLPALVTHRISTRAERA